MARILRALVLAMVASYASAAFSSSTEVGQCDLSADGVPDGCVLSQLQDPVTLASNTAVYITFSSVTGNYLQTTFGDWTAVLSKAAGAGSGELFWFFGTCPTMSDASDCSDAYEANGAGTVPISDTRCDPCYLTTVLTQGSNPTYVNSVGTGAYSDTKSVTITGNIPNFMARASWVTSQGGLTSFVVFMGSMSNFPLSVDFTMADVTTTQSIPPSPPPPPPPSPPSPPNPPPSDDNNALALGLGIGLGLGIPLLLGAIAAWYYFHTKKKMAKTGPILSSV